ncbi:hypothetical protein F2Q70_00035053 [Brassica cretica]|uniref:Helicase C-terminal domain-containing protein n=1 Tax=Brassica cretica TaxID=69181 RepID=A0A8S9JWQ6_BRACR|nr:hypothetical protein F2Q70_00035053 [Brassica cretica]
MANSFTLLADLKAGIEFNLLRGTGVEFLRYDGNLAQKAREKVLQGFNQIKQKIILLISKKAGRVGLNLTAASNDPWWTPAMEEEAIMRIHRIQHKRIKNHMEQPTAICVLKAGLHSVMRMTDFKYLATFPCETVPFTAEEERPPDLSCDGAAKNLIGGQVIETKLRSVDGLSKKKNSIRPFIDGIRTGSLWKRNSNLQGQNHLKKSDEDRCIYENYKYHLCLLSPPTMANSFTLLADLKVGIEFNLLRGTGVEFFRYDGKLAQKAREKVLQGFNQIKQKIVLLISKKPGGVGLNLTATSNDLWWTSAMEEEAIMRIHRIQHKRIRNHMEQPTAICVLKSGLHSVMRMTDFKDQDAMKETLLFYGTEEAIEEFPFTVEEERPRDLSCDGAAKKSEYVRV